MPKWVVIGCPGHVGQVSPAASSQSVKAKSNIGASGVTNSFQFLDRKPSVGQPKAATALSANGLTAPFGWLPAEKALKRPAPNFRRMLSAMIERALLPVQRKRTLKMRSVMDSNLPQAARGKIGDQRRTYVRTAAAAVLEEEQRDFAEPGEIGAPEARAPE
jgi:hypothetical protein